MSGIPSEPPPVVPDDPNDEPPLTLWSSTKAIMASGDAGLRLEAQRIAVTGKPKPAGCSHAPR